MKSLVFIPLLLSFIPSADAGIYIYPFFNEGIEVRCADNEPKHLISFKAGRVMKFEDDGEEKYKFPATYLYPEKPNNKYSYFPSTAGTKCSYRKLSKKEKKFFIKTAFETCIVSEKIRENCYGWN
ncbi:hypothetical protein EU96_1775 [Prochlorococcus marinus str. MIT 9302]|uniref:Uncharacterized protein n=1 Tax=Prochlorococcus marinus str. MIT 9302 TaxID=74545 RepID=A0A0A2A9F3_PROMR|nr:hypothetical protein [Prochlorococcus marinus]KGF97134.1 hypothetical protein EU96_1775 [Prochlorococcus marinus str. MIT 9302]